MPEDRDEVAGAGAALAQRVERGDAGAQQRAGVLGDRSSGIEASATRDDHVVGVAAVVGDARDLAVLAADHVAAPAGVAVAAVAAEPADADPLADLPGDDALADGLDAPGDLVAGHASGTRWPASHPRR